MPTVETKLTVAKKASSGVKSSRMMKPTVPTAAIPIRTAASSRIFLRDITGCHGTACQVYAKAGRISTKAAAGAAEAAAAGAKPGSESEKRQVRRVDLLIIEQAINP